MKQQLKEKNSAQNNDQQANATQTETSLKSTNRNQDVDSVAGVHTEQIYASGQTLGKRTYYQSLVGQ